MDSKIPAVFADLAVAESRHSHAKPAAATAVDTIPGRPGKDRHERTAVTPPVPTAATPTGSGLPGWKLSQDWMSYQVDFWQRSILFLDTLREGTMAKCGRSGVGCGATGG
jgi:hypothetical protein